MLFFQVQIGKFLQYSFHNCMAYQKVELIKKGCDCIPLSFPEEGNLYLIHINTNYYLIIKMPMATFTIASLTISEEFTSISQSMVACRAVTSVTQPAWEETLSFFPGTGFTRDYSVGYFKKTEQIFQGCVSRDSWTCKRLYTGYGNRLPPCGPYVCLN